MTSPEDFQPLLPDILTGTSDGSLARLVELFHTSAQPSIPGLDAVWLAPNACLMQSHQQPAEGEPLVVHVVGVADYGDWTGAVLMLD